MLKETYAIYMAVKKLSFYLADTSVTLWGDCLHLKHFLQKTTLNAKINNWKIGASDYNIKFKFIKSVKSCLPIFYPDWLILN